MTEPSTSPIALRPPAPFSAAPDPSAQVPVGVLHARARLDTLAARPVAEHVEVFDGVHRLLQDCLATLDEV